MTPPRESGPLRTWILLPGAVLLVVALVAWDVATGRVIERLETPRSAGVSDLAVSPDGRLAASGGRDGAIYLWGLSD